MSEAVLSYEELIEQNTHLQKHSALLEQEVELLKFQLEQLKKHVYGNRSERLPLGANGQQALFGEDETEPQPEVTQETTEVEGHKRKKRGKKRELSGDIPRERIEYLPDEQECSECGGELTRIGEEVREELDFIPATFILKQHVSIKCACSKCKQGVYTGKLPAEAQPIIEKSPASASLLAHIIVSKFDDHLPLYRQEEIFARKGIELPRKKLCDWLAHCAEQLSWIPRRIQEEILASGYAQADETEIKVQDTEKDGSTHRGRIWVLRSPVLGLTYYQYDPTRSTAAAQSLIGPDFKGALQSDGYAAYDAIAGPDISRLGCLAHVRRKFVEARSLAAAEADSVIKLIAELYKLEKKAKRMTGTQRYALRQKHALPILHKLELAIRKMQDTFLPKHPLHKAANYALNQWRELVRYTENGCYEIDNNAIERAIRPIAVGRKNWMFAGSHDGAQRAAIFYTIIENCKAAKVNPYLYIKDVLVRSKTTPVTQVQQLLPQHWTQEQ